MQNQKVIEQLGYSDKEAKVYLAALYLGEAHLSDIAAKVSMPRSSVQTIVDKLHKDGLMNFYVMRRYKYWVAEHPDRLLEELKRRENILEDAIPTLIEIRKTARRKQTNKKEIDHILDSLRLIADTANQPVLITNAELEIQYVNTAWERQFLYTLSEIQGQTPHIFKSGNTAPEIYQEMWCALSEKKLFQSDQIIDKRKDDSTFSLLTTIFSLTYSGNDFYVQILDEVDAYGNVKKLHTKFTKHSSK